VAYPFGSAIFTSTIKALQEKHGSRRAYAKRESAGVSSDPIGPDEAQFIEERDSFYMATIGETGWPYVQHRGGPKGFLKVIDANTLAFSDFRGNRQYISAGNLTTKPRVAMILVDYPQQTRLKILGTIQTLEGVEAKEWLAAHPDPGYPAQMERIFVIHVEATDWNCQQHITPRFSEDEIRGALKPWEDRFEALRKENEELRRQLERVKVA
jgi:predicted pyridoxine 5'-phosphate oxidase superfamily flavin-nucleotide-binding protein